MSKIDDSPESSSKRPSASKVKSPVDPRDPEGYLRRCCGFDKANMRCTVPIDQKSYEETRAHSTFLPTCPAHRYQKKRAGWCQFEIGEFGYRRECGRLFIRSPRGPQLCFDHQKPPPICHLFRLPLELRLEIFRYLLPSRPLGSSTSLLHQLEESASGHDSYFVDVNTIDSLPPTRQHLYQRCEIPSGHNCSFRSAFPTPFINLLLINKTICAEVKNLLYSVVPFTIDVRRDGAFMCGRRILPPSRPDGSPHYAVDEMDVACKDFIRTFDLEAAKNYNIDILVENWLNDDPHSDTYSWDEEVEIYDIRDYVTVVITGILHKSENLCRLNVRIGLAEFRWSEEEVLANTKLLLEPFERLRNVRQPRFCGVFGGKPEHNYMMRLPRPGELATFSPGSNNNRIPTPLCSVPLLAVHTPILRPGDSTFDVYRKTWERQISQTANCSLIEATPIRAMFSELKDFYTKLALLVPDVGQRPGRHEFLHRARVARDHENIEAFRLIRNELMGFWYTYLEQEELRRNDINAKLYGMLDADFYPSPELEEGPYPSLTTTASHVISPVLLDTGAMTAEKISIQSNTAMTADGTPNVGNLVEWREPQQLPLLTDTNRNHSARTSLTEQQMQGWEMAFVHNVSQAANEPLQTASVPSNSTMPQRVALFPSPPPKNDEAWSGLNEPLQAASVPSNSTMPQRVAPFPSPPPKNGEDWSGLNEPLQAASVPSNSTMPQRVAPFPSPPPKNDEDWSGLNEPLQAAPVPSNSTMPQRVALFPSPPPKNDEAWSGLNEPLQAAPVPSNSTMPQQVALFPSPPQKDGEDWFGQKAEAENRITLPCNDFRGAYTPTCLLSSARRSPYKRPYKSPYKSPYITSPQASHASGAYSQHGTENHTSIGYVPPPLTNDSPGSSQGGSWMSANSFLNGLSSPEEQHWVGWEDSNGSSTQSSGFGAGPTEWNFEIDGHGAEARVFHDSTQLHQEIGMHSSEHNVGNGKGKMRADVMDRGVGMMYGN